MGIFDKVKGALIETEEDNKNVLGNVNVSSVSGITSETEYRAKQPKEVVEMNNSDLISVDAIYSENGLSDNSKSIYKVNEIRAALPDMPSDSKKASVIGMLTVSKIDISEIENDAEERIDTIIAVLNNFTSETQRIVDSAEEQIAEKEKEIEELKNKIADRKQLQERQGKLCEDELELINATVNFIK